MCRRPPASAAFDRVHGAPAALAIERAAPEHRGPPHDHVQRRPQFVRDGRQEFVFSGDSRVPLPHGRQARIVDDLLDASAIVRQLVELHGGTVAAESGGSGKGALVTIDLPRATDSRSLRYPARESKIGAV
jgi:hypothetical protein